MNLKDEENSDANSTFGAATSLQQSIRRSTISMISLPSCIQQRVKRTDSELAIYILIMYSILPYD